MIIQCKSCSRKFIVRDTDIPKEGRSVQCGYCSKTWHQNPVLKEVKQPKKLKLKEIVEENDDGPSIDSIKASDGKTYKFLGNQWAELLPSGKTGLFARKKIGTELDEITGRKEIKTIKSKRKKIEEFDPSSVSLQNDKKSTNANTKGMGFFGYIFLIIIIGFSLIGILKTFESDIILYFPEIDYVYEILNEQLVYISEAVKNIITIVDDLIANY